MYFNFLLCSVSFIAVSLCLSNRVGGVSKAARCTATPRNRIVAVRLEICRQFQLQFRGYFPLDVRVKIAGIFYVCNFFWDTLPVTPACAVGQQTAGVPRNAAPCCCCNCISVNRRRSERKCGGRQNRGSETLEEKRDFLSPVWQPPTTSRSLCVYVLLVVCK